MRRQIHSSAEPTNNVLNFSPQPENILMGGPNNEFDVKVGITNTDTSSGANAGANVEESFTGTNAKPSEHQHRH